MIRTGLKLILTFQLFSPGALAHQSACEAKMAEALELLSSDDRLIGLVEQPSLPDAIVAVPQAEIEVPTEERVLDILLGLEVPKSILDNREQFKKERELARSRILPQLGVLQRTLRGLSPKTTLKEKLKYLAELWDEAGTEDTRKAILVEMMRMFSISNEQVFMDLIANGRHSIEMKTALYDVLAKLFKHDPSWRPYLDRAANTAGIPR